MDTVTLPWAHDNKEWRSINLEIKKISNMRRFWGRREKTNNRNEGLKPMREVIHRMGRLNCYRSTQISSDETELRWGWETFLNRLWRKVNNEGPKPTREVNTV